jgi:hypothetical protein
MPITGLESADGVNQPPKLLQKGGPVKKYDVEINGVQTTIQLTDEDAKARGLTAAADQKSSGSKAKTPANKAAAPVNKAAANKGNG